MAEYGESAELAAELALEVVSEGIPAWYRGVAFTVLVLSVVTALAALLAGMTAHETLLDRTEEIIDVSVAETDQLTVEILRTKHELQVALGQSVDPAEIAEIERMEVEAERYEDEAAEVEASALGAASNHLLLAIAATIAAIAIAVTGLAPIVFQRWLWVVGIAIGSVATAILVTGVIRIVA